MAKLGKLQKELTEINAEIEKYDDILYKMLRKGEYNETEYYMAKEAIYSLCEKRENLEWRMAQSKHSAEMRKIKRMLA